MIGRSANSIRKVEASGALPMPKLSERGRRTGYTLAEVNGIREHFGVIRGRQPGEEPIRMAFQNFKGGVGKSTLCTHFSQYLVERGHRVLVIDCDSQASTTTTFGLRPDLDLGTKDTLLPFFDGSKTNLDYAIRETYWDRLHIIPSNLSLYSAEYELAATAGQSGPGWIGRLHEGISTIQENYDVVIMDPPPALGMISLNVVRSANALIIPTPPAMYDFHSTVTFFRMMEEVLGSVEKAVGHPLNYKFLKLLISKYDTGKSAQEFMVRMMGEHYARHILNAAVKDSAEIDNAAADWRTVYELQKHTTSAKTYRRCIVSLNAVFREIEMLIRGTWPSHQERLEAEGYMVL
jgi:chromosome partitioning protein